MNMKNEQDITVLLAALKNAAAALAVIANSSQNSRAFALESFHKAQLVIKAFRGKEVARS